MIQIKYRDGIYFCFCDFVEKDLPKRAGFTWDSRSRVWCTPFAITAARLAPDNPEVKAGLKRAAENVAKSNAIYGDLEVPVPDGLSYRPYQLAGIDFMRKRRAVLLGDEMGIGKTIQAIGLFNYHKQHGLKDKAANVLIVCPATLKRNWQKEWAKWAIEKQGGIGIAEGSRFPNTRVVIINYDILRRHADSLRACVWDILIMDECQYLKNSKALRTKQICGDYKSKLPPIEAKCKLALTGTPIPNRPIELYSVLRYLDPLGWHNKLVYAKRYCAAESNGWGWDMSGASHLDELQEKLRSTIMIRRLKKDVLKDLPDKERQVIELEIPEGEEIIRKEKRLLGYEDKEKLTEEEYKEVVRKMRGGDPGVFEEMSTIRRENAVAKIPAVIEHLQEAIDASGKVVCFCHHKEVAAALLERFRDIAVVVTGSTPLKDRHTNVERFQEDPRVKLFIGNIIAAGTGITLTASSHVVFAELDWVPGNVSQAEDRCHRIGQKDSVLVQHLVMAGSIDSVMAKTIIFKQSVIEKALNPETETENLERMLQ